MKECKYELCHNEPKGASAYCSNSCRAQQSRRNKTGATSEAQQVVNSEDIDGEVKLDQPATDVSIGVVVKAGQIMPKEDITQMIAGNCRHDYVDGPPVRSRVGGCKCAIPGDEDYQGVCYQDESGRWTPISPTGNDMVDDMLAVEAGIDMLEHGVGKLSRAHLQAAIKAYPADQWVNSPEHKELLHRLHTRSVAELESDGYFVPAWKRSA